MYKKLSWVIIAILLVAFAAACTPQAVEPGAQPEQEEVETPEAAEQAAPEALPAARLALSEFLGVMPDAVELEQIEDAEWPNACLGLAEPGEMCAEVITPGYAITFSHEGESYVVRTDIGGEAVRIEAAATATDELPPAVETAREALAGELGIDAESIELLNFEQREWPNACLGLPDPGEMCAEVITPGWQVVLGAEGVAYQVRTDMDGDVVRFAADVEGGLEQPPVAAVEAQRVLAQRLNTAQSEIEILEVEQAEWSDSCLGLGGPAESCLQVITPGFRVMLGAEGEVYEARTDLEGQNIRIAEPGRIEQPAGEIPGPELEGAVVFFQRSGGIAGDVLTVRVYEDGLVERVEGRPGPSTPIEAVNVDPAEVEALLAELEAAGYFELNERSYLPEDTCCDRFFYLMNVEGEEGEQIVEALEATPENPEALTESITIIEAFVAETFE
ncbi:MAG: hypothetical protein R3272_11240 [Candidatus Promineifilaceae bacterium]|nr:hypothetical protein [Candidatus Promineifilaceae bacterium]